MPIFLSSLTRLNKMSVIQLKLKCQVCCLLHKLLKALLRLIFVIYLIMNVPGKSTSLVCINNDFVNTKYSNLVLFLFVGSIVVS